MTLEFFSDTPRGVEARTICLPLQGQDTNTGRYVECRVTHNALMEHCGARGQTDLELMRAFNQHREKIEEVARRKYNDGPVEGAPDGRAIFYLDVGDF